MHAMQHVVFEESLKDFVREEILEEKIGEQQLNHYV